MKKFSERINESIIDKDPIDPSEDVKDFREKFGELLGNRLESQNPAGRALNDIESSHPTMTDKYKIYKVLELDDYGRELRGGSFFGYYRAVSPQHARVKAAVIKSRSDIFLTGYFGAEEISDSLLETEISKLNATLSKIQKQIDDLKNPL
jgi:hypothetical protein